MAGLLLAIDPYIARLDDSGDIIGGYFGPINTTELTITQPDPETITRTSRLVDSFGQALDSFARPQPAEVSLTFDEILADTLAWAFLGTSAGYSQTAQTAETVEVTAALDKWVHVGYNNITNVSAEITGPTTLTLGTDYELAARPGLIKILSTNEASVDEGTEINVTLDAPARTGYTTTAGTDSILRVALRGAGKDLFSGADVEVIVPQMNLSPTGGINLISEEPFAVTLSGNIIKQDGLALYSLSRHSGS